MAAILSRGWGEMSQDLILCSTFSIAALINVVVVVVVAVVVVVVVVVVDNRLNITSKLAL